MSRSVTTEGDVSSVWPISLQLGSASSPFNICWGKLSAYGLVLGATSLILNHNNLDLSCKMLISKYIYTCSIILCILLPMQTLNVRLLLFFKIKIWTMEYNLKISEAIKKLYQHNHIRNKYIIN